MFYSPCYFFRYSFFRFTVNNCVVFAQLFTVINGGGRGVVLDDDDYDHDYDDYDDGDLLFFDDDDFFDDDGVDDGDLLFFDDFFDDDDDDDDFDFLLLLLLLLVLVLVFVIGSFCSINASFKARCASHMSFPSFRRKSSIRFR